MTTTSSLTAVRPEHAAAALGVTTTQGRRLFGDIIINESASQVTPDSLLPIGKAEYKPAVHIRGVLTRWTKSQSKRFIASRERVELSELRDAVVPTPVNADFTGPGTSDTGLAAARKRLGSGETVSAKGKAATDATCRRP